MDDYASDSVAGVGSFFSFNSLPQHPPGFPIQIAQYSNAPNVNDRQFAQNRRAVSIGPTSSGNMQSKPIPLISLNVQPSKGPMQRGGTPKKTSGTIRGPIIPPGPVYQFTLNAKDVVCFFGRNHFLSNFFQFPFQVEGCRYYNVEHYYEAVKLYTLLGPQYAVQLQNVNDPSAAKSIARRMLADNRVARTSIEKFRRDDGIRVVMHALMAKFYPGTDMARRLLDTGSALLAQANAHDDLWAVNMNATEFVDWMATKDKTVLQLPVEISGNNVNSLPHLGKRGKNVLGFLLMEVRRKLNGLSTGPPSAPLATIREDGGEGIVTGEDPMAVQQHGIPMGNQ